MSLMPAVSFLALPPRLPILLFDLKRSWVAQRKDTIEQRARTATMTKMAVVPDVEVMLRRVIGPR